VSQITPTQTTCSAFSSNTATTLGALHYAVRNGKVASVNPGVFFYWVKGTASGSPFTIVQTEPAAFNHSFTIASGSFAYDSNCNKISGATITQAANGDVTVTLPSGSSGTIFIGIKYNSKSVEGFTAPGVSPVTYSFSTNTVAGSTSTIDLVTP
jgi:hypothetical protein